MNISGVKVKNQNENNETGKTGSFCGRVVEPGLIGYGVVAGVGVAAYWLGSPILGMVSLGAGVILVCKSLFARKLESNKITLADIDIRISAQKYNDLPLSHKVEIIKQLMEMLNGDHAEEIEKRIIALFKVEEFESETKFQAVIEGFVAYFEKVAKENDEKVKDGILTGAIYQLKRLLVEMKVADIEANKQSIDLNRLHQALDNLIIENKFTKECISEIKRALPLSNDEQLVLNFKNMGSRNTDTRYTALKGLAKAYSTTAKDQQVAILKAMIKMLNDNTNSRNGYCAMGELQQCIINGTIDDAAKVQALVDGFTDYFKNPGGINFTSLIQENDSMRVFEGMNSVLMGQFIKHCLADDTISQNVNVSQLKISLKAMQAKIPNGLFSENIKENIQRVLNGLK